MPRIPRRPGHRSPLRRPVPLRLLRLEDRTAPAVFNIPNGDTATLIAAVNTANANNQADVINLAPGGTYTFTQRADLALGASALPPIALDGGNRDNRITINGNGATVARSTDPLTLTFRFLRTGPSTFPFNQPSVMASDLVINDLTIRDFDLSVMTDQYVPAGAGVYAYRSDVRLTNCILTNNRGANAVGVTGAGFQQLMFDRCALEGNDGGVVTSGANVWVTNTRIVGNGSSGSGVNMQQADGGSLEVSDSVIRDNGQWGIETLTVAVVLQRSTVADNGQGGIYSTNGGVHLVDSTISGNGWRSTTPTGGVSDAGAVLTVTNSTIDGNRGRYAGGFSLDYGHTNSNFGAIITQSTITNNVSTGTNNRSAGGMFIDPLTPPAQFTIGHTIIAGNRAPAGIAPDVSGAFASRAYNFFGDGTGMTVTGNLTGNQVGTSAAPLDPRLGLLKDNGGSTFTRLPLPGSPVVNSGDPALAAAAGPYDQRGAGFARVQFGRIDIGAVEVQLVRVQSVAVNGGAAQRSRVTDVTVTFETAAILPGTPAAAFRLTRTGPGAPAGDVTLSVDLSGSTASQTVARLTFSGPLTEAGSLVDGSYTLTVLGTQVVGTSGQLLDGNGVPGGDVVSGLYRLFGDINGDRAVNGLDLAAFRSAFGATAGSAAYIPGLDFDGDGVINGTDLAAFRSRFGAILP